MPLYYAIVVWLFLSDSLLAHIHYLEIPPDNFHLGWWRYVFMLNGFVDCDARYWTNLAGTWTIPIFVFFYLIAPFTLRHINRLSRAFCAVAACFILKQIFKVLLFKPWNYNCPVANYIYVFFIGVLIYHISKEGYGILAGVLSSIGVLLLVAAGMGSYAYLALFSVIVLLCLELDGKIRPSRVTLKVVSYIDAHSYALYLMHGAFIYSVARRIMTGIPTWKVGVLIILGSMAATWFGHNLVEVPIKKLFIRKS